MAGSNTYSQLPQEPEQQQPTPQPAAQSPDTPPTGQPAPAAPSNYGELYTFLQNEMNTHKPETPEQKKKRERREKWEGIVSGISDAVSSLSNLYFTSQYAPNMYDGEKSMSAKAKERRDRARAEREANAEKYLNYALTLGKAKDADEAKAYQRQRDAAADARADRAFDFQKEQADRQQANWQATFDRQAARDQEEDRRWQISFDEGVRQFNVTSERQKQQLALEGRRLALQQKQGQMSFNLGPGKGNVTLSSDQLNAETVSRIYHTLPQAVRDQVHGQPIYTRDMLGNQILSGYGDPTTEAMLIAIGANVQNSTETQDAIREVAGQRVQRRNIDGF